MNRILFLALLLFPLLAKAANPAFTQFNTNHFTTNGYIVSAKGVPTNANLTNFFSTNLLGQVTNIVSSQLTNGHIVYVDQIVGSDVLARRWGFNWPNRTPRGGRDTAARPDTVWVRPGIYTNNALLKDGVNWHWMNGATCFWQPASTNLTNSLGIFDDRASGSVTCNISGEGTFILQADVDFETSHANMKGLVYLQNSGSLINFKARRLQATDDSGALLISAFYISDCNQVILDIDEIEDPNPSGISYCYGVYWERGNVWAEVKRSKTTGNCVYAFDPVSNTNSYNMYYRGLSAENSQSEAATVYLLGNLTNRNYRLWCDIQEIISQNGPAVQWQTGGKIYVNFLKASTGVSSVSPVVGGNGSPDAWVTGQKITGKTQPCIGLATGYSGRSFIKVMELEDGGSVPSFVSVVAGNLIMQGPTYARGTNAIIRGLVQSGGTSRVENVTFDLRACAGTTNRPVELYGGKFLSKDNVFLAGLSSTNSIFALTAQTMSILGYSTANTNESSAVTINSGTFIVNGNVQ